MQLTLFLQITNLSKENRVLMVKLKKVGKTGFTESENISPKSDQSSLPCHQESKLQATITSLTDQEVNQFLPTKNLYLLLTMFF